MEPTAAQRIRAEAKEATRQALLDAGLAEIIDRGGEIPSVEVICSRAGYTRGAFYVYFEDRDQFVNELLGWVLGDIIQSLFLNAAQEAADIRDVVVGFCDMLALGEWPALHDNIRAGYLAILRELRPGSVVEEQHAVLMGGVAERLGELAKEAQDDGLIRRDVDPEHSGMLLLLSAIGAIMWDRVGISFDVREVGQTLLELLAPSK